MLQPSKQCVGVFEGAMKNFKNGIYLQIRDDWQIRSCFEILDHKIIGEEGEIQKFASMINLYCDKLNLKLVQKSSQ
ncbi:hypothetical protein OXYTRIMIC_601 [Oxytricha trifallax]|uniref:Uncharacterized protein n=1 Tax=Oxytricha trifallax TaxID=1172189 RepID=A0A073HZ03_9SPIT|nr:hypothetical protein OXYTRIMIC_601 [Oxytricha trifallax]